MYKQFLITTVILAFLSVNTKAQGITGKWIAPGNVVIQFYEDGQTFNAKQISAETEKDKIGNNKLVAKGLRVTSTNVYEGTVIDPKDDKNYKGTFIINKQGNQLELKVKWGFMSFKEIWKRDK
ncbi:DUF2147 domain-containing protein [Pedobacter suwonensis]|uniref:DUF2147 domain-containing protein n=1 Tax=Pedobacter suwonensis TaxID=332999 RepID=UPI003675D7B9